MTASAADAVLDDPIGSGLRTAHAGLAQSVGAALRYRPNIAPFCSVGVKPDEKAWDSLRTLTGGMGVLFMAPDFELPKGWQLLHRIRLTQMVMEGEQSTPSTGDVRALNARDVPEMMRLTALTQPGPFAESTIELGGYAGVFDGGNLVAMAGRRMNPPGFVEVSAVCTDPDHRGRGLARAVMSAVLEGIADEGSRAFLHVAQGNPARRLYEDIGFVPRKDFDVLVF